ncbi:hypothetical protein [Mycobacterium sp. URHB0044]|uniref:hypothetical protein n=1 Tax=Mycobacterium sp. URHB0044 TaxID=1380386 RepID=UPI00048E3428|nr:hypothetical protein [Mycobacterium sp. URHB0044]
MSDDADGPVPLSLLADLQAGLLDDDSAAALRRRVRDDPDAARRMDALDRVRRDLAELGADPASAPDVPVDVVTRVTDGLRTEPPRHRVVGSPAVSAAHAARASGSRFRNAAAAVGVAAALVAAGVGTAMLLRGADRTPATGPTAERITVSSPVGGVPLTDAEILALLGQPPDLGPLADPQRRASCLSGLGYPTSATVLGARPLSVGGRSGVLMLLPGDTPQRVNLVVVALNCSSADTGLLAERAITRR